MKIKFLGAAGTVTGSSTVITSGSGQSLLIDMGMFQGISDIEKLNHNPPQIDYHQLSGVLLTHAHLDHCGRLPVLIQHDFSANVWMTRETSDITQLSLIDSAKIIAEDSPNPLFDKNQVHLISEKFNCLNYHAPVKIGDFSITFRDAGHILGSAILEIEDLKPSSDLKKIVFSGDLGNSPEDLLKQTDLIDSADIVVMESTYGDRLHPKDDPLQVLQSEINIVESTGGTLLIPAFSLERSQELLHSIMHLKKIGKVQADTSVFLDSPLARKVTSIYLNYPNDFNSHVKDDLKIGNPFSFPGLKIVATREESAAIHDFQAPKVIIAGSGMMTGGRIVSHAHHYLPDPSTRLLIVGYQGEGTLGKKLQSGEKLIAVEGQTIKVNATVTDNQGMSSHADQSQLISWLSHIKGVKKLFLNHGEDGPRKILAEKITTDLHISDISIPSLYQEYEI